MWKLLRNTVLLALLLAGALKLLLGYAAGQESARLAAQLAPFAQLRYDGVSAGLNGNVELTGVVIAPGRGRDGYSAEKVALQTPGPLWLLQRWMTGDNALPPRLGIDAQNIKLPTSDLLSGLEGWISPISMVPFETQGCGIVSRFSVVDYQRMGLNPAKPSEHIDFRFDADTAALELRVSLLSPGFSNVVLHTEIQHFDPRSIATAEGLRKLHVTQFSFDYADQDYLQRRNRFCAQQAGVDANRFIDQHMTAVAALLQQHHIEAGAELTKLYRSLVTGGGRASVLSLPRATFNPAQAPTLAPDELLRQLNITARYNDTPPIMFRLAFTLPETTDTDAVPMVVTATAPAIDPPKVVDPPKTTVAVVEEHPRPATTANTAATQTTTPTTLPTIASTTPTASRKSPPEDNNAAATKPKIDKSAVTASIYNEPKTKEAVVRPPVAETRPKTNPSATSTKSTDVLPSGPAPPPGSTLAMVWKAEIERLPSNGPVERDYDVIEYAALNSYVGRRVRLITENGKRIEGFVLAADPTGVQLRLGRPDGGGGNAQMEIARPSVREVQLLKAPHSG